MNPKLSHAPLTYVLLQVRFTSILKMEGYIPSLQDSIRDIFPHNQFLNIQTITLGQQPSMVPATQWYFTDKEKLTGIILDNQMLTLQTSCYESFQSSLNQFQEVAKRFHEILKIGPVTRLGLRYLNLITDGLDNINKSLQGFQLQGDVFASQHMTQTLTTQASQVGTLVIRSTCMEPPKNKMLNRNLFVSNDLEGPAAMLSFKHYPEPKHRFCLLDIDHFSTKQLDFDVANILKGFTRLHDATYDAFSKAVGPTNLKQWK